MGVLDQRKLFRQFAKQMKARVPLSDVQFEQLAEIFSRVAQGEDANTVLQVKPRSGVSVKKEKALQLLSVVLSLVATLIDEGKSQDKAFFEGSILWRRLHGIAAEDPSDRYSPEALRRAWHKHREMQSPERHTMDPHWPL